MSRARDRRRTAQRGSAAVLAVVLVAVLATAALLVSSVGGVVASGASSPLPTWRRWQRPVRSRREGTRAVRPRPLSVATAAGWPGAQSPGRR